METPHLPLPSAASFAEGFHFDDLKTGELKIESIDDLAIAIFGEDLDTLASRMQVHDDPMGKPVTRATQLIKIYLIKMDAECARCVEYRSRGWNDNREEGDAFFKRQRERADTASGRDESHFYKMMLDIGEEMNSVCHLYDLPGSNGQQINILDICMAPGGYTAVALRHMPEAHAYGITLPIESGGHSVVLDKHLLKSLRYGDVTMFKEYCPADKSIPKQHPDYKNFSPFRLFTSIRFNFVFCDGAVLRTHQRGDNRPQEKETIRLQASQLILALQRIQLGGTIVMLLHKVDTWHSAILLYAFSKFSSVSVFKPQKWHSARSSFYLVAQNVNPQHVDALKAVEEWKQDWWRATFAGEDGLGLPRPEPTDQLVQEVIVNFGPALAKLGHSAWKIQADALSRTDYAGSGGGERRSSSNSALMPRNLPSLVVNQECKITVSTRISDLTDVVNSVTISAGRRKDEQPKKGKEISHTVAQVDENLR
ncbi:hypothetical protein CJF32_00002395 [Rutstroemia sp. NJR-2017a WRK4]|nr:hypothetical protein CJF32_00002164 [Rutstroemia sp. NJR-2017a WRK4]PQE14855.1 hypothetical protein CJF32_00002395 [Rutstroemia sp. NJR-2017a WRK4]